MTVITFPCSPERAPRQRSTEEVVGEYLGCWVPPSTWTIDENDVVYLDDTEYNDAAAFFAQYGFMIERQGPLVSFREGWLYLAITLRIYLGDKKKHPATYSTRTQKWSEDDHDYLAALVNNDLSRIVRLAPLTLFARELQKRMKTPQGTALRHLALVSLQALPK